MSQYQTFTTRYNVSKLYQPHDPVCAQNINMTVSVTFPKVSWFVQVRHTGIFSSLMDVNKGHVFYSVQVI